MSNTPTNSLDHARFSCFPVVGEQVLNLSPQSVLNKLHDGGLSDAGNKISRRLSQPLMGATPEAMVGMLYELPPEDLVDFLGEPRSGNVEKMMSSKIVEDYASEPVSAPALSVSPSLRQRSSLSAPRPTRS